ncbi:MAG: T9SS type A sorting domain-containing protein [Bacteroidota bacterium]|nr:T9SS type A sorting domain-containing protein [Bacteroidota bacterium]
MKQFHVITIVFLVTMILSAVSAQAQEGSLAPAVPHSKMGFGNMRSAQMNTHDLPLAQKDYWDSLFNKGSGYDSLIDKGYISAIASDGDDLYLAGSFEYFDGIRCYNIIHYNRASGIWSKMDSGFSSTVNTLQIHNGKLYAGGRFGYLGFNSNTRLQGIAEWNATTKKWEEVGGGVNSTVMAIAFMDTSMIIGGYFTSAGTLPVSYIARWNGHAWDDMNGGIYDAVYSLLPVGDSLFVGGRFYSSKQPVKEIALYSEGNWQSVGDGLSGPVYTMAMVKGQLWVGGDFTTTGSSTEELISLTRWDGNNWIPFANATDTGTKGGEVFSIMPVGDSVYIGGSFYSVEGTPAHGIVKWSNNAFSAIGKGVYGEVSALGIFNNALYVGGTFLHAGNDSVGNISTIASGDHWQALGITSGAFGGYSETSIDAVASTPQYIFIGGSFSTIGEKEFNHIAAWDKYNRKWISLGKGVDRDVSAITIQGSNVYVGGSFNFAGDNIARHIAYWNMDTKTWHPMGEGAVRYVSSIAANETGVYASVFFPLILNKGLINFMGKWDGSEWVPLPGAINGYINAVAATGATLVIGGQISSIDSRTYSNIATFDGLNWTSLGTGVSDRVLALVLSGTDVYAAGDFAIASGVLVNGVARWDGTNWNDLGGGLNAGADALAMNGSDLYVGGYFDSVGGVRMKAPFLAKWDGSAWSSVSNGVGASVYALAVDQAGLYVGGGFTHVNGGRLNSYRFGILHFATAGVNSAAGEQDAAVESYPNPFSTETKILYSVSHDGPVKIEIYNILGAKVRSIVNEFKTAGAYEVSFDGAELPNGTYICSVSADGRTQTKRLSFAK